MVIQRAQAQAQNRHTWIHVNWLVARWFQIEMNESFVDMHTHRIHTRAKNWEDCAHSITHRSKWLWASLESLALPVAVRKFRHFHRLAGNRNDFFFWIDRIKLLRKLTVSTWLDDFTLEKCSSVFLLKNCVASELALNWYDRYEVTTRN